MKDDHTYDKKRARKGHTKDIYKGTFICIQTLSRLCGLMALAIACTVINSVRHFGLSSKNNSNGWVFSLFLNLNILSIAFLISLDIDKKFS